MRLRWPLLKWQRCSCKIHLCLPKISCDALFLFLPLLPSPSVILAWRRNITLIVSTRKEIRSVHKQPLEWKAVTETAEDCVLNKLKGTLWQDNILSYLFPSRLSQPLRYRRVNGEGFRFRMSAAILNYYDLLLLLLSSSRMAFFAFNRKRAWPNFKGRKNQGGHFLFSCLTKSPQPAKPPRSPDQMARFGPLWGEMFGTSVLSP